YKGAGLKFGIFPKIASHTGVLWKSLGKNQESFESLITQLREYKLQRDSNGLPNAYSMPYSFNQDTPLSWWTTCEVNPNQLQYLALRLFSITPSSAACELYCFNLSQIGLESKHTKNKELTINDIYALVNSLFDNIEEKDNDSQDVEIDQATILDSIYPTTTTENLKLEISTFVDFNSQIFESFNSNKNNFIADENSEDNDTRNFDDYDPETIVQNMGLDE
ncbi:22501_t:CDS:2, partial [Racocetra persica]